MLQGCFSSLYIGILAATCKGYMPWNTNTSFSSLYIGILAATARDCHAVRYSDVSVPFTSGSSLQPQLRQGRCLHDQFQFPLHRDPRCNHLHMMVLLWQWHMFQFPLHRDPRCNL